MTAGVFTSARRGLIFPRLPADGRHASLAGSWLATLFRNLADRLDHRLRLFIAEATIAISLISCVVLGYRHQLRIERDATGGSVHRAWLLEPSPPMSGDLSAGSMNAMVRS